MHWEKLVWQLIKIENYFSKKNADSYAIAKHEENMQRYGQKPNKN